MTVESAATVPRDSFYPGFEGTNEKRRSVNKKELFNWLLHVQRMFNYLAESQM